MSEKQTGFRRFLGAFRSTQAGLTIAWKQEEAFRQEVAILGVATVLAFIIGQNFFHSVLLIMVVFNILIVELLNTAVENAIDRIGPERHDLSKFAKDTASAAVFMAFTMAIIVWLSYIVFVLFGWG